MMQQLGRNAEKRTPDLDARTVALWEAVRQALLMVVNAIEVYLCFEVRTAELRKRLK